VQAIPELQKEPEKKSPRHSIRHRRNRKEYRPKEKTKASQFPGQLKKNWGGTSVRMAGDIYSEHISGSTEKGEWRRRKVKQKPGVNQENFLSKRAAYGEQVVNHQRKKKGEEETEKKKKRKAGPGVTNLKKKKKDRLGDKKKKSPRWRRVDPYNER